MKPEKIEKIKTVVWSVILSSIVTMIIGFAWGGWVLGSTSQNMGEKMAENAVAKRLTPICYAQYNLDPEKVDKFNIFKSKYEWDQNRYVEEQGWATMPFEEKPDADVAALCSDMIMSKAE